MVDLKNDSQMDTDQPHDTEIQTPLQSQQSPPQTMGTLLAAESLELTSPKHGELRNGTIARVSPNAIWVDIGAKSEGIIPENEINIIGADAQEELQVGAQCTLYVVRGASQDGPVVLSLLKARQMEEWKQAKQQMQESNVHTGQVLECNRGGLVVTFGQLRGFLPASLMTMKRQRRKAGSEPSKQWKDMIGEELTFKITEVDTTENRLIVSERAAEKEVQDEKREQLLASIQSGQTLAGRVVSLADFGAFVDLGSLDGLVHISQISWQQIDHPREVLKVGQEVNVRVISVDRKRQRVGLSLKALEEDPWNALSHKYKEGQLVRATITRLAKFGAFAALKDDEHIEGLVHISELAERIVVHPKEVVRENEEVTLRIMKIESERRRVGLSLKEVASARYADLDYDFYIASAKNPQPEIGRT